MKRSDRPGQKGAINSHGGTYSFEGAGEIAPQPFWPLAAGTS